MINNDLIKQARTLRDRAKSRSLKGRFAASPLYLAEFDAYIWNNLDALLDLAEKQVAYHTAMSGTTHSAECYKLGPRHYKCALERIAELEATNEALDAKLMALSKHETCGCSYDTKGGVCLHHSPQLLKATERIAELESERDRLRAALVYINTVAADLPDHPNVVAIRWRCEDALKTVNK